MDNFSCVFSDAMERATAMVTYCMLAAVVEKTLEAERNKVKAALGHEPTLENWQYLYELQKEEKKSRNTRKTEIDREKLRRLVFGEDDSNSKAS